MPCLKTKYNETVKQQLQDKFQYENVMMIPKMEKIVVNMGVGEAATDSKAIEGAVRDLRVITGQQPMVTCARKSIATFHLRAGMPIGAKVTLRGDRMWEFFDRLTSVAIPRIRDFRGISAKSFDGRGNFSMGVTGAAHLPRGRLRLLTAPAAWTSPSSPPPRPTKRPRSFSTPSASWVQEIGITVPVTRVALHGGPRSRGANIESYVRRNKWLRHR